MVLAISTVTEEVVKLVVDAWFQDTKVALDVVVVVVVEEAVELMVVKVVDEYTEDLGECGKYWR